MIITQLLESEVKALDPLKKYTGVFLFEGAFKFQKHGENSNDGILDLIVFMAENINISILLRNVEAKSYQSKYRTE